MEAADDIRKRNRAVVFNAPLLVLRQWQRDTLRTVSGFTMTMNSSVDLGSGYGEWKHGRVTHLVDDFGNGALVRHVGCWKTIDDSRSGEFSRATWAT